VRGHIEEPQVLEVARTVGLNVDRMKTDMKDAALDSFLERNVNLAQTLHITGTPGFVAGDQITTGATDLKTFQTLIAKARGGHQEEAK